MSELKLSYKPHRLDMYEVEELVAAMCGVDDVTNEFLKSDAVEEFLYDRYEISTEQFDKIIGDIIPLCRSAKMAISGGTQCGLIDPNNPWFVVRKILDEAKKDE